MSKNTLNESTQKRLLLLAGLSSWEDEVLSENFEKKGKKSITESGAACAPGSKKTKDGKEVMLDEGEFPRSEEEEEEVPSEEGGESAGSEIPSAPPAPPVEGSGPPTDPNEMHSEAGEGGNFVDVDFTKFAAGLADLLKQNFPQVNFTMQANGQEVTSEEQPMGSEDEFTTDDSLETAPEEGMTEPSAEMPPEEDKNLPESKKKKKDAVKLVYEAIIKNLVASSGGKVNTDKKVEIKVAPKETKKEVKPTATKK